MQAHTWTVRINDQAYSGFVNYGLAWLFMVKRISASPNTTASITKACQ